MTTEVTLQRGRSSQRFDVATLLCSVQHQESGKCDILLHSGVKVTVFHLSYKEVCIGREGRLGLAGPTRRLEGIGNLDFRAN